MFIVHLTWTTHMKVLDLFMITNLTTTRWLELSHLGDQEIQVGEQA